ncbi:MAG: hypothetical protein SFY67_18215 [Candidatus Melainabacteria bacterium]|nr:hypothetical protein [Candidatus Melainabacteria bacterium]
MKLYVIYDDSSQASQQDLAIRAMCLEMQKKYAASYLKTLTIDPNSLDVEKLVQAITLQKEKSSDGPL